MIIAYIGPDGSGKSTAMEYSITHLKDKKTSYEIFYPFNYYILRKLIDFIKNKNGSGTVLNKTNREGNKNTILKIVWPILALVDSWLWYLHIKKSDKKVLLCDRYFHDLYTSFDEFNLSLPLLNALYIKLAPKPDKVVLLLNDPNVLQSRETDDFHSLPFFERQVTRYTTLASGDSSIEVLKGDFTIEDINRILEELRV